jgi:alkylation response protein AidB-like acyl-CoA dehydrogenase
LYIVLQIRRKDIMDLGFSSAQDMLRKSVAEFLAKECPFEKVKELEESDTGYDPKLWKKMVELGWLGCFIPKEYGGDGGPFMDLIIILEEIGKAAYPSPLFSTVIQCGWIILEGGSEEQKKALLSKIARGKLIMSLAQFEQEAGYLASEINMPARLTGDKYVLNGTKMFVMDANIADSLIVVAGTDEGVTLFLVDAKDAGVSCTKMPTIAMDNTCEVILKDVKVSKENVIGSPGRGWEILEKMSQKAVVAKCAEMLGGCKACIDMTADYAKKRVQYGKPIGGYQIIQHYMADMLLGYDATVNYLYKTAWMIDEGMDVARESSALKAKVNEQNKFITEQGIQIHGAVGTTREFNVALFFRRAKSNEFMLGDTDHHYEKVVQALGM